MSGLLSLYDTPVSSRLLLGTAQYPSPQVLLDAIAASSCNIITTAVRRQNPSQTAKAGESYWQLLRDSGCHLLPNTAGCRSAQEAITTAEIAREIFQTSWLKLEVIGDDYNLQPDPFALVDAAEQLVQRGFQVFPYCTDDLILCRRLVDVGCKVLMPWGSPIGTGQGLLNKVNLITLRERFTDIPLIIDAGIGAPSHASEAMELGFDAVLLNTAVARARQPATMAHAFAKAIAAGRLAWEAGLMQKRQTAVPSTPTIGQPFWHNKK